MSAQTMSQWLSLQVKEQVNEPLEDLIWPTELPSSSDGHEYIIFDPRNDLAAIYGNSEGVDPALASLETDLRCSRIVALIPSHQSEPWSDLGFQLEGKIVGYWQDQTDAELWSKMSPDRAAARLSDNQCGPNHEEANHNNPNHSVPSICRVVDADDAVVIGSLMAEAFPGYQMPTDPGVIRYALASGAVHGRGVFSDDGHLMAYASVEFQRAQGSVEITDCATGRDHRGQGLMTQVLTHLQQDLTDVFAIQHAHCFARQDQLGMQQVMTKLGWTRRGQLRNHFKVGGDWLSAWIWGC